MKYWTYIPMTVEELEELVEADLSPDLRERLESRLADAQEHVEGLERAKRISERLSWNAEMNRLMGQEP